jgi:multiple sugar transport system substrate-binding protein
MIKTTRRGLYRILILSIFLILSPLGCGISDNGETVAPAIISVWYSLSGTQADELIKQCNQITKTHPDLVIKPMYLAESEFIQRTWQYQAGGEGPEIFVTNGVIMDQLFSKGALSPIQAKTYNVFEPAKIRYSSNEQIYALPMLIDVPLLFYRTDLVDKPDNLNALIARNTAIFAAKYNISLLSGWWKAEGGGFVSGQTPMINTYNNLVFLNKVVSLRSAGVLNEDSQAVAKFMQGEEKYLLDWGSTAHILTSNKVNWGCVSLATLIGENPRGVPGNSICIANSSTKSSPGLNEKVQLVEEELLKSQVEEALAVSAKLLPTNDQYYEGQQNPFMKNEIAKALTTAWGVEVSSLELKMLPMLDNAFQNSFYGTDSTDSALEKAQQQLVYFINGQK